MSLEPFIKPWQGSAFRHLPDRTGVDVFDFTYAGRGANNRWNINDEPTLYLAGDVAIAVNEWTRHLAIDRSGMPSALTQSRTLYHLKVTVDAVVDLCDPVVWAILPLTDPPRCFLDLATAQATAHLLRKSSRVQGLLVPAMGFIDDPDRKNVILFLDKLPADPMTFLSVVGQQRFDIPR